MKTRFGKISILGLGILLALAVYASSKDDIIYPVAELGGCESESACVAYCDDASHGRECLAFAKEHKILPPEEIERGEKLLAVGGGPGGCNSRESCEAYCNNVSHIDECVAFAEVNGFLSGKELEEAKKIKEALSRGAKLPGGCTNRNSCEAYCTNPDNVDECLDFAEESGFLPPEELQRARRFAELMKRGETPGNCRSKEECEKYCFEEEHIDECIAFAEKAGFLSDQDKELIRKTGGRGPGGCKSQEECTAYCQDHQEDGQCKALIENFGGGEIEFQGPGGCTTPEECIRYCQTHPEECEGFGPPPGFVPPEGVSPEQYQQQYQLPTVFLAPFLEILR